MYPVQDGRIQLDPSLGRVATDDLDGGDPRKVGLGQLWAELRP
jgi:hypothetical protein